MKSIKISNQESDSGFVLDTSTIIIICAAAVALVAILYLIYILQKRCFFSQYFSSGLREFFRHTRKIFLGDEMKILSYGRMQQ